MSAVPLYRTATLRTSVPDCRSAGGRWSHVKFRPVVQDICCMEFEPPPVPQEVKTVRSDLFFSRWLRSGSRCVLVLCSDACHLKQSCTSCLTDAAL